MKEFAKAKISLIEKTFTIISLFLYSGPVLRLIFSGGASPGDGQETPYNYPLIQVIFVILYFLTACLLITNWKRIVLLLIEEKFILLLIGLAFISIFWSFFPLMTAKRTIGLAGTTLFGIYFATRYAFKQKLELLGITLGLIIFLSMTFIMLFPEYGVMAGSHDGIWRGIYTHKNTLGQVMGLSCLVFLFLTMDKQKTHFFWWIGFSFSIFLLIFSTSKTSLLVSTITLTICCLYTFYLKKYITTLSLLFAITLISGSLLLQIQFNFFPPIALSDKVLTTTTDTIAIKDNQTPAAINSPSNNTESPTVSGKDIKTLTGRKQLWLRLFKMGKERFWLGYGYGSFWLGEEGPSGELWSNEDSNWKPHHSHNGLLDIWLQLGIIGLLIFMTGLLSNFIIIIKQQFSNNKFTKLQYFFYFVYITFFMLINLTTSSLLIYNNIAWVLYVTVIFSTVVSNQDERLFRNYK